MSDESVEPLLAQRLRAVIEAKDEQISVLKEQVETVLSRLGRRWSGNGGWSGGSRSWSAAC